MAWISTKKTTHHCIRTSVQTDTISADKRIFHNWELHIKTINENKMQNSNEQNEKKTTPTNKANRQKKCGQFKIDSHNERIYNEMHFNEFKLVWLTF